MTKDEEDSNDSVLIEQKYSIKYDSDSDRDTSKQEIKLDPNGNLLTSINSLSFQQFLIL